MISRFVEDVAGSSSSLTECDECVGELVSADECCSSGVLGDVALGVADVIESLRV